MLGPPAITGLHELLPKPAFPRLASPCPLTQSASRLLSQPQEHDWVTGLCGPLESTHHRRLFLLVPDITCRPHPGLIPKSLVSHLRPTRPEVFSALKALPETAFKATTWVRVPPPPSGTVEEASWAAPHVVHPYPPQQSVPGNVGQVTPLPDSPSYSKARWTARWPHEAEEKCHPLSFPDHKHC